MNNAAETDANTVTLTASIVSAYVRANPVPTSELAGLISSVHASVCSLRTAGSAEVVERTRRPAVSVKRSVRPDFLICLEDGKKFKSLKRHLGVHYGMTPSEYREKWNLPPDYPMVAPNYSAARSTMAKSMGLGRKPKSEAEPVKPARRKKLHLKFG
ncbi:MucR family transcriptional regulator [Rhodopseudomonas parapalustris]